MKIRKASACLRQISITHISILLTVATNWWLPHLASLKKASERIFRVNRSTVVSLKNIKPSEKEDQILSQRLGEIKISRRRKEAFKVHYKEHFRP